MTDMYVEEDFKWIDSVANYILLYALFLFFIFIFCKKKPTNGNTWKPVSLR